MKMLLYIVLLLAVLLIPAEGTDVGRLIPVEVIAVWEDRGMITVETDTGNLGQGNTLEEAFDDLEDTASGVIYLDTAEYLVLEVGAEDRIHQLRPYLKGDVRVCCGHQGISLEGIADYLSVHRPGARLRNVTDSTRIPAIFEENGRFQLIQK